MDYSVPERGGGYKAFFMLINVEIGILPGKISPIFQVRFYFANVIFKIVFKIHNRLLISFSAPCLVKSTD